MGQQSVPHGAGPGGRTRSAAGPTRRAYLGLALASAGAATAACGAPGAGAPGGSPGAPAGAPVTLEVWNSDWGQLYNDYMRAIGDDFTKQTPAVTVNWLFQERIDEKIIAATAGGSPPDTHYTNVNFQGSFAFKGLLRPLDDYLKATRLGRKDFIASMWDLSVWRGKLYAVPGGADWDVLFWNKGVFAEAGLDPEKPPRTFKELEEVSLRLLRRDGAGNITRIGWSPGHASSPGYLHLIHHFGGQLYDEARGKITIDHPKVLECLDALVAYGRKLDYAKAVAFWTGKPSYSRPDSPFSNGSSVFQNTGFWAYDPFDKYAPDLRYGVMTHPTATGAREELKNYVIHGWMYAIPTASKHPDAAWQFDRYAFVDQAARMGYLTLNGPCPLAQLEPFRKAMVEQVLGPTNRLTPHMNVFLDVARAGTKYLPPTPVAPAFTREITNAFRAALSGEKASRDALADATKTVQAELDQALRGG
jgi:multiple sugar transport system substrate-binding protein